MHRSSIHCNLLIVNKMHCLCIDCIDVFLYLPTKSFDCVKLHIQLYTLFNNIKRIHIFNNTHFIYASMQISINQ
nr:MAG TPA: hypothetical protein [Caudoviricetes sp.]